MPTHEGLPRRSTLQTMHRTRARGYEAVSIIKWTKRYELLILCLLHEELYDYLIY